MKANITIMALAVLGGCQQQAEQNLPSANVDASAAPASGQPFNRAGNEAANPTAPDDRTPLAEPRGPIDPKSAEAAGQVVQHYGALIEQGRWAEASAYWSDAAQAAGFEQELKRYREVHLEIGKLGDLEGAAGSIYVSMQAAFYGKDRAGEDFRRPAEVVLRRVNDVPGSTAAQRRWHVERINWKEA